ncbi:hypothetical protein AGDE_12802 [Angomonas deanei]|nr:hypothetical protein AGDE_12802 [Angomonas deanei]|eukprot:EPY23453.1 hypothetical protein AGDE_12802 [Angomonas deanei]
MSASESNSPNKGRRKIQPQAKSAESYEVEVDRQLKEEGVPHIARKRVSSQVFPQGTENHTEQTYTVEVGNGNQLSFRSQGEVEKPFTEYKEEPEEKSFNSNRRFHDHNKESAPEEPKPVRRASRPQQRSSLSFGSAGLGSYN